MLAEFESCGSPGVGFAVLPPWRPCAGAHVAAGKLSKDVLALTRQGGSLDDARAQVKMIWPPPARP